MSVKQGLPRPIFYRARPAPELRSCPFETDFSRNKVSRSSRGSKMLKERVDPDVILTHRRDDAHQDHRQVSRLAWNTFRDHCILEYEIPKWDGDIGQPNLYMPDFSGALQRKIDLLISHFGSQRSKQWFDAETFLGLARLRGMECRAPERYAEAFFARKIVLS